MSRVLVKISFIPKLYYHKVQKENHRNLQLQIKPSLNCFHRFFFCAKLNLTWIFIFFPLLSTDKSLLLMKSWYEKVLQWNRMDFVEICEWKRVATRINKKFTGKIKQKRLIIFESAEINIFSHLNSIFDLIWICSCFLYLCDSRSFKRNDLTSTCVGLKCGNAILGAWIWVLKFAFLNPKTYENARNHVVDLLRVKNVWCCILLKTEISLMRWLKRWICIRFRHNFQKFLRDLIQQFYDGLNTKTTIIETSWYEQKTYFFLFYGNSILPLHEARV